MHLVRHADLLVTVLSQEKKLLKYLATGKQKKVNRSLYLLHPVLCGCIFITSAKG